MFEGVYIPPNKQPISQKSLLASIIIGFFNLNWQNLSTAPGDCIRLQQFVVQCLASLQRGDFVRKVYTSIILNHSMCQGGQHCSGAATRLVLSISFPSCQFTCAPNYSRWQQNREYVMLWTGRPPVRQGSTIVLPPTMPQPPGTLLQPLVGVVVGGTMVGGAPPTRGNGQATKRQRGKDNFGIV